MILTYNKLNQVTGVDGYILYDEDYELIDSTIVDIEANIILAVQEMLKSCMNQNLGEDFGELSNNLLLTEKGAWHFAKVREGYLAVLAGINNSVDVAELAMVISKLKQKIT